MSDLTHIRDILGGMYGGEARARAFAASREEWQCRHPRMELRVKTSSAGKPMYVEQCLRCGGTNGGRWISPRLIDDPNSVLPFDEDLRASFREEQMAAERQLHQEFADHGSEWWKAYNAYLETAHWRDIRRAVIERAGGKCEGCGRRPATQAHHLTYTHVGNEFLWELRAVCDSCHTRVHHQEDAAD